MITNILRILILVLFTCQAGQAQIKTLSPERGVSIDDQGVMRWDDTDQEIKGFGVNYTVPFAHAYRSALKLGVDPLEAIDQDVYHFWRLGFNLYRVHVWDTEISDTLGNLLSNAHLNAFDYLLKALGERNINYVLTPIAFWGGGWPEPDEPTPGFSAKYGKDDCLTNNEAIKAQENYLTQFMKHINSYTGVAYKDDPRLIAVEISNEPHHREPPEDVTKFIRRMVDAVRRSGFTKPVFYNISHSVHLAENYFKAGIQGGTFQWYPTGLGYQRELPGNFLPNADNYLIPFDETIRKYKGAKLVYEFDAADIGKSYIYPAMARSFREAGIQIATHFSYDPMFLAYANTEYNTHYMNLAYTPHKALSLKICSEIFNSIPMYKDYGGYPENTTFEGFSLHYGQDLAMLNTEEKYFYTNSTRIPPLSPKELRSIAGHGNSPILKYDGTGAYFLDKLESGVWRLEVMPDVLLIDNPFGRNSLEKTVAVIQWNERRMEISLHNLGREFNIQPLNTGNDHQPAVNNGQFLVTPGTYLLVKEGINTNWDSNDNWEEIRLGEFQAPGNTVQKTYVVHNEMEMAIAGEPLAIEAKVISPDPSITVQAFISGGIRGEVKDMVETQAFTYKTTIPGSEMNHGFLKYYLVVESDNQVVTFPANKNGMPYSWDFIDRNPYSVRIIDQDQPIYLFNAQDDWTGLSHRWWEKDSRLTPTSQVNEAEYQIRPDRLHRVDNENLHAQVIHDYTVRYYFNQKIDHLRESITGKNWLVLKARSLDKDPKPVQIALVTKDGTSWGKIIELGNSIEEYEIPLDELKKVKTVTMPRPYPTFLPYYFISKKAGKFNVGDIEGLQITIGPGLPEESMEQKHSIGVVSIMLK